MNCLNKLKAATISSIENLLEMKAAPKALKKAGLMAVMRARLMASH